MKSSIRISIFFFTCALTLSNVPEANSLLSYGPNRLHKYKEANQNLEDFHDEPLFLTPLLEAGDIETAQYDSYVKNLEYQGSWSGFITVNKTYNSNIFFWTFMNEEHFTDLPYIIWLQGGPGGSSLFGEFVENGPIKIEKVDESFKVKIRDFSWNREFGIVYIDNPVGSGFSFTDDEKGYARNEDDVVDNLIEFLKQWIQIYRAFRGNELYIAGESYGAKYAIALAHRLNEIDAKEIGFNLQGVLIGNGWADPRHLFDYGPFLYQNGMIDEKQLDHFLQQSKLAQDLIDKKDFIKAHDVWISMMVGDGKTPSYFENVTGFNYYYNFLLSEAPEEFDYFVKFLGLHSTRKALHVGNLTFGGEKSELVSKYLVNDIMDSVKPKIENLLELNLPMLFYNGQLDVIVPAAATENLLLNLNWHGGEKFKNARKSIYYMEDEITYEEIIAGYKRKADSLYYVTVRNAGHMVPYDQPNVALDLITKFIKKEL